MEEGFQERLWAGGVAFQSQTYSFGTVLATQQKGQRQQKPSQMPASLGESSMSQLKSSVQTASPSTLSTPLPWPHALP